MIGQLDDQLNFWGDYFCFEYEKCQVLSFIGPKWLSENNHIHFLDDLPKPGRFGSTTSPEKIHPRILYFSLNFNSSELILSRANFKF